MQNQGGIHVGSAPEVELQGLAIAPAAPAGGFHTVPLRQHKKYYIRSRGKTDTPVNSLDDLIENNRMDRHTITDFSDNNLLVHIETTFNAG